MPPGPQAIPSRFDEGQRARHANRTTWAIRAEAVVAPPEVSDGGEVSLAPGAGRLLSLMVHGIR